MRPGFDLLGIAHPRFPFGDILRSTPKESPIGFFWDTFGDVRPRFRKMMAAGFHIFRVQIYWADNHTIVPLDKLRESLRELYEITHTEEQIKLYVSPSCEHAEKDVRAVKLRLGLVKELCPNAIPVNNPWKGNGADVAGYLHEYHGSNPGKCDIASTDGTSIYDIDAAKWVSAYGNKEHPCFLWGARYNLREVGDRGQQAPPIPKRTAAPSVGYHRSILRLALPKGTAPDPDFDTVTLGRSELWKTHAEDDQEQQETTPDERRENRPVLIIAADVSAVDILNCKGEVIGKLPRYGDFPGGLTRYYSGVSGGIGLYGYEIGKKAKNTGGSEYVGFRAGEKVIWPVHPAFRAGVYRS